MEWKIWNKSTAEIRADGWGKVEMKQGKNKEKKTTKRGICVRFCLCVFIRIIISDQ